MFDADWIRSYIASGNTQAAKSKRNKAKISFGGVGRLNPWRKNHPVEDDTIELFCDNLGIKPPQNPSVF